MRRRLWAALCLASAPVLADAPKLAMPLDCTLYETCFIEDYVDLDPGDGARDYTCAFKTRDGHRGTDFHLMSYEAMEAGVDVLAAAPGRVSATRDGMQDIAVTPETRDAISKQGCGNAVRIDHGDGWQTLYCHLKQGSVSVAQGQIVETGAVLGQVGLSGLTNAPHLHIGVRKDGKVVDPFLPVDANNTCGVDGPNLWDAAIPYERTGFYTVGFSTALPTLADVDSGAARVEATTPDTPLVLYGYVFFAEPGDVMTLWANAEDGTEIFRTDIVLDDPRQRLFRAYGRKGPQDGWAPGIYRGSVQLRRGDRILATRHTDVVVRL